MSDEAAKKEAEENVKVLLDSISEGLKSRAKYYKLTKPFAEKTVITRSDLLLLNNCVASYDALKVIDTKLAFDHQDWLSVCGKTAEDLETEDHKFSPSHFGELLEQYCEVSDKVEAQFVKILDQFPEKTEVTIFLSRFASLKNPAEDPPPAPSVNLEDDLKSSCSGKGADYAKTKIPKIKDYISTEYSKVELENDLGAESETDPRDLVDSLNKIYKILDVDGKFDKLLRELEESDEKDEAESYETWQTEFFNKIGKLRNKINKKIKPEFSTSKSKNSTFQTFFKKLDPPKFDGDCLEYIEWRTKWKSVVSTCEQPPEFELDRIKENIPEQAKKKLFDVHSLPKAWDILDRLYGDKKLISQKLKNKMKNLEPTSIEPHEKIIEINEEVDYLVKRLVKLEAQDLLISDNDYLNAIYSKLPHDEQRAWDVFDQDEFDNEWQAFSEFLGNMYQAALRKRTRVESLKEMLGDKAANKSKDDSIKPKDVPIRCFTCQEKGHKSPQCPTNPKNVKKGVTKVTVSKADVKAAKDSDDKMSKRLACPCCGSSHTWKPKNKPNPVPATRFSNCPDFLKLDIKKRGEMLENSKGCIICTSWFHTKDDCTARLSFAKCQEKTDGKGCSELHNSLIHGCDLPYCTSARTQMKSSILKQTDSLSDVDQHASTLMLLQDVPAGGAVSRLQWDGGANKILVTHEYAKKAGLLEVPAEYCMQVVGKGWERIKDVMYIFDLETRNGEKIKVWGYGIDAITDAVPPVDLSGVRSLFPHVPPAAFDSLDEKPLDILVGLNFFGLHPGGGDGKNKVGNLKALQNDFGHGWVIGGSHPNLKPVKIQLTEKALAMVTISKVEINPFIQKDFWELENLGVEPPKRCGKCKSCKLCSDDGLILSCQEEEEFKMIDDSVTVKDGISSISFPFIKNPNVLSNNRNPMLKRSQSLEQSLKRRGLSEAYNTEFKKFLERGVIAEVSQPELDSYSGPVNYISHHGVLQPRKVTTPLRIVSNSSQDNRGHSLNSCIPKGPNSLCDMYKLIHRFRTYEVGLACDISKAYHTLRTGVIEKFLRLMIWRFSDVEEWRTFGYEVLAFGDRVAAGALESSKRKCADQGEDIDPSAAKRVKTEMYVDDGVTGGTATEVARFIGNKDEDGKYDGTIQQILALGGFSIKSFASSGCTDEKALALLGGSVLGYSWDAKNDIMGVKIKVNLSKKKRKIAEYPDLTLNDLEKLRTIKLTKRNLLGVPAGIFDPIGIASVFTIKLKIGLKQLFDLDENLSWDDEIPANMKNWWVEVLTEAIKAEMLNFPRGTKPNNAIGSPILIGFCDGALPAYAANVYIRWEMSEPDCQGNKFSVTLLCAKAKVTPINGCTTPKSELNAATLLSRLIKSAAHAIVDTPSSVVCAGDSQCVISSLELSSTKFKPYFHNRISEIRDNFDDLRKICPVEEFYFVPGKMNPADMATRENGKLEDVGVGSEWQSPEFLKKPRELWPLTRDFVKTDPPSEEMRKKSFACFLAVQTSAPVYKLWQRIEELCNYSNDWDKVLRLIATISRGPSLDFTDFEGDEKLKHVQNILRSNIPVTKESTPKIQSSISKAKDLSSNYPKQVELKEMMAKLEAPVSKAEIVLAEKLVMLYAMNTTWEDYRSNKLTSLLPFKENFMIYTRGRVGEAALERILGIDKLPILSSKSRVAWLLMFRAHTEDTGLDHRGVAATLAKSRTRAWITQGGKLAKRIRSYCNYCKLRERKLESQQMALIRDEQLQPCPPFTHVCLDYMGPQIVHDEVKKRVSMKIWVLVYTCRSTRAVELLAVSGYSTDKFLIRHKEFVCRHGNPQTLVSDRGTSLVKAGMIFDSDSHPSNWNWKKIVESNRTTNWTFTEIGCQWRNGLSEAMVKLTKKCLKKAVPSDAKITYGEYVTLLAHITYTINCRPIGVFGSQDLHEEIQPLTPNQLLLGRSDMDTKAPEYDLDISLPKRSAYVQNLVDKWWSLWIRQVWPHLVPCRKWKSIIRNIQVGDVCLLNFPGSLTGKYKLVRVVDVHPDSSGIVRTVSIIYKKRNAREKPTELSKKSKVKEKVGVQRLIVIQAVNEPSEEQPEVLLSTPVPVHQPQVSQLNSLPSIPDLPADIPLPLHVSQSTVDTLDTPNT